MTTPKVQQIRRKITQEAARIMANEGIQDFLVAKRKAAAHLGISESRFLPRNLEIKDALEDYQRLFQAESQPGELRMLREVALEAMQVFAHFEPRLVGDVLDGIATQHSNIVLHLFADPVEEVATFLDQQRISCQIKNRRLRINHDNYKEYPLFQIMAGDHCVDLLVFPRDGIRQAPCSPIDGRPMRRATLAAVREMLGKPM